MDVDDYWDRLQAAEKEEQAASAAMEAFGVTDPTSQWTPGYEAATTAAGEAWVHVEEARHELDAFLNPERYAREGYSSEALHEAAARRGAGPDREAT